MQDARIDLLKVRAVGGSQNRGFEELCVQLAASEHDDSTRFRRVGAPDAGIEAYWDLPEGEQGYQAKFFTRPPDSGGWGQIDESIKRALETHPRLRRYTVCLPINRSDARLFWQKSFMKKWDDHVAKWEGWAKDRGMSVTFDYWGESEILQRLASPRHAGAARFWLDQELFDDQWLRNHVAESRQNAGPLFGATAHVDLPIADVFDGLARDPRFFRRLAKRHESLHREYSRTSRVRQEKDRQLLTKIDSLYGSLHGLNLETETSAGITPPLDAAASFVEQLAGEAISCAAQLTREATAAKADGNEAVSGHANLLASVLYRLREGCDELFDSLVDQEATAARRSALLVRGEAGVGKSQLFIDVAEERVRRGAPTFLLFGKHFRSADPWQQIAMMLGVKASNADELLGLITSAAQLKRARGLILIDAINEGDGSDLWPHYLAGLLKTVQRFPWVCLALSVRSSYEELLVPETITSDQLTRVTHYGFSGHELSATERFFTAFQMERPPSGPLVPEFSNPSS